VCRQQQHLARITHQGLWRVQDQPSLQHTVGLGASIQLSLLASLQEKPPH
jgi:hypothetical protein